MSVNNSKLTVKRPALRFQTGEDIYELRRKLKLNQQEFWSALGVTQSGGSRYENGRTIPTSVKLLLTIVYGTDKQSNSLLTWLRAEKSPH